MEKEDILILRQILRKPIIDDYNQKLTTGDWQFNEDGTVQIYAGNIKTWYYLQKDLIFRFEYNEGDLLNINNLNK